MIGADRREAHLNVATPAAMAGRPVDHRGFPVPWFVTEKDAEGNWDFVQIRPERFAEAWRRDVCWVSGTKLGRFRSFCIGPMCVVNRVAGDPPVRRDVAIWSVQVCPFMSRPLAKRSSAVPEGQRAYEKQRGAMVEANPGIMAIYTVTYADYRRRGGLAEMGDPSSVEWWTRGRPATQQEVDRAFDGAVERLTPIAEIDGRRALDLLDKYLSRARPFFTVASSGD